jgi:hypothetical protein
MSIISLPLDIQNYILSYLYYTKDTTVNLSPSLFLIKNYHSVIHIVLNDFFKSNIAFINKMLLRFLLKDENHSIYNKLLYYNVKLDYELFTKAQIKNVLFHLNILETNKLYNFCTNQ